MKHKLSLIAKARKLERARLQDAPPPNRALDTDEEFRLAPLDERLRTLLHIIHRKERPAQQMLFFIMYDITSNKVRTLVSRYLIQKGCTRVQRSIFLADLPSSVYETIKTDLTEVQAAYDNNDSILIVPIPLGQLEAMHVIGQDIGLSLITHQRNTLFF